MPKAVKKTTNTKPVQPVAATPPVQEAPQSITPVLPKLPVIYDKIEITEYSTTSAKGPLTIEDQKALIGWETEKEYQQRMVKEKGGKPEHYIFGDLGIKCEDGTVYPIHCKNVSGEKVVCKFNAHNRPFDEGWCQSLIHTVLYGQWAGPHTIPGETVNGETIRISRYGRVLSGQHQITACILADEWLKKARASDQDPADNPKYPAWKGHESPFLETIVVTGMSEDHRVLMTVDYVKPRTAADVFYTSDVFKSCTSPERKELCRILASAVDTLWTRTDARGYKTHPEVVGFLERHKRLLKCVEHLFEENSVSGGRKIAKLRLQPGVCAALMFIQGSSGPETDGDMYRNESPPTEKSLDWSYWDKAEEFWTLLAAGKDFMYVRTALGRLVDSNVASEDNQGLGGRVPEKLAIVAKAWELWRDSIGGVTFTLDDLGPDGALCLSYSNLDDKGNKLPNDEIKLLDIADFYGIDCPESIGSNKSGSSIGGKSGVPMPPPPSREEIEKATEEARKRRNVTK